MSQYGNLPPEDPCRGPSIVNRIGQWGRQTNLPQGLPDCGEEGGLIFLAFDYSPLFINILYVFHVRNGVYELMLVDENFREPGGYGNQIVKMGDYHFATLSINQTDPNLLNNTEDLMRSSDGGLTWEVVFPSFHNFNISDIKEGPDGTFWAIREGDELYPTESIYMLWKSTDSGATWERVFPFIQEIGAFFDPVTFDIAPDGTLIAYHQGDEIAGQAAECFARVSRDNGVSWSNIPLTPLDDSTLGNYGNVCISRDTGRAIIFVEDYDSSSDTLSTAAFYSDDYYNWTRVYIRPFSDFDIVCDPGFGPAQWIRDNEFLFGGNACLDSNQIKIYRTTDGGESWDLFLDGLTGGNEGGRFLYHDGEDILYIYNTFSLNFLGGESVADSILYGIRNPFTNPVLFSVIPVVDPTGVNVGTDLFPGFGMPFAKL